MAGDADRRARLAAIASGGTAGANAYDDAQKQVQGRKVAAIDAMTADAGQLGGGQPNVTAALDQMVGDPYDTGSQVLGDASQSYGQQLATMAAGTSGPTPAPAAAAPAKGPWGGYGTESSYVNAVKGKAEADKAAQAQTQADQMQTASNQQTQTAAEQFADQYAKQQSALTLAPGTVIHGPGFLDPKAWVSPPQTPSAEAGVAAQVAAREMIEQGAPTTPPPPPGSTYDPAAAARAGDEGARIGLSNPGKVQSIEQPYMKALNEIANPDNNYQFERNAALSMGADKYATMGRFSAPTDAEKLKTMQDQQALDSYIQSGATGPSEARTQTDAQRALDYDRMAGEVGITPGSLVGIADNVRMTPEAVYGAMKEPSWGVVQQIASGTQDMASFSSALTNANNAAPADQKMSPEEIRVALAYYAPLLGK